MQTVTPLLLLLLLLQQMALLAVGVAGGQCSGALGTVLLLQLLV